MKTQYDYWKEAHDQVMAEMAATVNYTLINAQPNKHFKYIINIHRMLEFHDARQWMSQTYGFTEDIEEDKPGVNEHWAFFLKFSTHKIYLKGDEELSWFKIKWGKPS